MRIIALAIALLAIPSASFGATAYEAMRAAAKERGDVILKRVIELRGLDGTPEPLLWQVALDDPLARGGVRVMDVKEGKVVGERTPVAGYATTGETSIISLQQLNLDSSGAFRVADKAATEQQIGFDRVDYALRLSGPGGAPVWFLTLFDVMNAQVGTLRIAADTGALLEQNWAPGQAVGAFDGDASYVQDVPPVRYDPNPSPQSDGEKIYESLKHFGKRAERHFRRDGAALERFFTGESDIDEGLDSPTPSYGR